MSLYRERQITRYVDTGLNSLARAVAVCLVWLVMLTALVIYMGVRHGF